MNTKNNVLKILIKSKGQYVSGESIANSLNVSRNSIWKAISKIKEDGIEIISSKKLGYMIPSNVDVIHVDCIREHLIDELKDIPIVYFNSITSTNDYAKSLAKENYPEYTLVISDTQTKGKGRMGRTFISPAGTGIYMSLIIYPKTNLTTSQLITSCVAVAISKAIDEICNCNSKIKWVNDIFLNDKKISGTLTEGAIDFETNSFKYAIIGTGINVRSTKDVFDTELSEIATSIEDVTGLQISRSVLIAKILNSIYEQINSLESKKFIKEYIKRSWIIGKDIIITENGTETSAKAIGIDKNAGLIVKFLDGSTKTLNSGEARIKKV